MNDLSTEELLRRFCAAMPFERVVWRNKPKRTWGRTLLDVLMLLALAALVGWLLHCVKHAGGISHSVTSRGVLLAMVPWQQGSIMVLLAFACVALVAWVFRKARRNEVDAWDQAFARGEVAICDGPAVPVSTVDALHIVSACAYRAGELRLNATLALTGDEVKLAEIPGMAERLQGTLLELKKSMALQTPVAVPEGDAWNDVMGGSGS